MKKTLLFTFIFTSIVLSAQSLSYLDQAVIFSTDDNYGTARFTGLSGAFGALGGDMTAVDINPAGLAVYNRSEFSTTLNYRETNTKSTYYGSSINNSDDHFRFSQIGGVIPVNNYGDSDFKKFAIGFNYNMIKDYNNNFAVNGNSGIAYFTDDPYLNFDDDETNNIYYTNVDDQFFSNYTSGINDRFTLSLATQYKDFLFLGASLSFQHIDFFQNAYLEEYNNDGNGNLIDAFNNQFLTTYGNGFNFGLGAIFKPNQNLRLGLAYQSPIWYEITEKFLITDWDYNQNEPPYSWVDGELDIIVSNDTSVFLNETITNLLDYKLNTPGKLTGSLAYVFGNKGLISFDYTYQDYTHIKLKPSSYFIESNNDVNEILKSTSSIKIGTEWNVKNLSLRGGYRYAESPYKNAYSSANIQAYSLGLGLKFTRSIKFDFAYDNTSYTEPYKFINLDAVQAAKLDMDTHRFTSTLVFNF
ncbi:MAG: outer membrane protein transport protein [Flavobacteriaceae bacterium]|nr:outer membrane protein transport protein [Flavobacteriaceae bacterium]